MPFSEVPNKVDFPAQEREVRERRREVEGIGPRADPPFARLNAVCTTGR